MEWLEINGYRHYLQYCRKNGEKPENVESFMEKHYPNKAFMMFLLSKDDYHEYIKAIQ
ncbi:MAG TPA: hypothetical protein IAA06_05285 [Candidatus Blautia faecavium]|uniref:Uncharacterized protein n=1 Tax=Candidatus Blautia faecavium TaxID=2838487 RepID=A0A9D2LRY5_9FIRM|nr:hypothetical protein [Candidatus Blautia faecavium]